SIAREHLVPKSMEAMGIEDGMMEVTDDALRKIISDYTMEAGVRGLRKRIDTLCRTLAVQIATRPDEKVIVTPEVVDEEIDARPIQHSKILPEPKPGVVTGLAWTPVGGEILYIETMFTKGKGEIVITGQLGDVMKESARIAVSLVKTIFPDKANMFAENDLHIHVPEGAVPKDGPSAGIALTTALSSLVTGFAVDPHIAMTGEVALRGAVTPIGGLPEKLMAAERAGITKVFIPEENEYDLKDVADEVKEKIEIKTVSRVGEVLAATGILAATGKQA
ncbi:MAG: endopeptidase La, partial [Mogibacterium sp.]|nr:endopeptidase La [Mogibacterium sp.]